MMFGEVYHMCSYVQLAHRALLKICVLFTLNAATGV